MYRALLGLSIAAVVALILYDLAVDSAWWVTWGNQPDRISYEFWSGLIRSSVDALCIAASVVALVLSAQRREWPWFGAVLVLVAVYMLAINGFVFRIGCAVLSPQCTSNQERLAQGTFGAWLLLERVFEALLPLSTLAYALLAIRSEHHERTVVA